MLRKLTAEEIEQFASRENVRRIAVENFLMTVANNLDMDAALINLCMDAKSYDWDRGTLKAITHGVVLAGGAV